MSVLLHRRKEHKLVAVWTLSNISAAWQSSVSCEIYQKDNIKIWLRSPDSVYVSKVLIIVNVQNVPVKRKSLSNCETSTKVM